MDWTCIEYEADYATLEKQNGHIGGSCDVIVTVFIPRAPHGIPAAPAKMRRDSTEAPPPSDEWEALEAGLCTTEDVPAMPCGPARFQEHRNKWHSPLFNACVAWPVPKKEAFTIPLAKQSLDDEWRRLRSVQQPGSNRKGCWDEDKVQEAWQVKKAAKRAGKTVHFGRVFDICVEKGSEPPEGDPKRKFKGRAVFGGDTVRDEAGNWAIF